MAYLFESEEHHAVRHTARRFAQAHIAPHGAAWEEDEEFPVALYVEAARAGITGIGYPEGIGGQGGDLGHVLVAGEELILGGRSVGTVVGLGTHGIALPPIVRFGTDEQQRRFVTPCLRDGKISALAITEPGGGSDVASLATCAVRDGEHYVVTGAKTFITSGTRADFVTAAVRTGNEGHAGVSLLVIEKGTAGFSVSKKLKKTGWWASDNRRASLRWLPGPGREPHRRRARRVPDDHDELRRRAPDARRTVRCDCRARVPGVDRVRPRTQGFRQAADRISGHAPQARRHGQPARRCPCTRR
jgi:acyl-CoA dehydrogenase